MAYDNPRDRKDHTIKALVDYYDKTEFNELAARIGIQPQTLARNVIKDFIRHARQAQQFAQGTQKQA